MRCEECPARGAALYARATSDEVAEIERARIGIEYAEKGDVVIADESASAHVYSLRVGWACRYVLLADGRRQILSFFAAGDFLTLNILAGSRQKTAVRTLTPAVLCRFARTDLQDFIDRHANLRRSFFEYLRGKREGCDLRLVQLGVLSAEEAIASLILQIAAMGDPARQPREVVEFPLKLVDIADAVGITEIHAGRVVRALERDGAIERLSGGRLRLDHARLKAHLARLGILLPAG